MPKIDILQMEVDNDLPHWLSPEEKNRGKLEEIRARIAMRRRIQNRRESNSNEVVRDALMFTDLYEDPAYTQDPATGKFTGSTSRGGSTFASPNFKMLGFDQATAALNSHRHAVFQRAAADVDKFTRMGKPVQTSVLGAWTDGAEHSTMMASERGKPEDLRLNAAMKGILGNQKAVLIFNQADDGPDSMYTFSMTGKLDAVHARLLGAGLDQHTLIPEKNGARVVVVDLKGTAAHKISKVTNEAEVSRGKAEFIGTEKEDGTDAEQREDAARIFRDVIQQAGPKAGAVWEKLRDRWLPQLEIAEGVTGIAAARSPWREEITSQEWNRIAGDAEAEVLVAHAKKIGHKESSYKANVSRKLGDLAAQVHTMAEWTNWYDRHKPLARELFGEDEPRFSEILAITSIQKAPGQNLALALSAYKRWKSGRSFDDWTAGEARAGGVLSDVRNKLNEWRLNHENLEGAKIEPFSKVLKGDWSRVVVDRQMVRAIFDAPNETANDGQVAVATRVITAFANRVGWTPAEMQAALWCLYKANSEKGNRKVVTSFRPYLQMQQENIRQMFRENPTWKPKGTKDAWIDPALLPRDGVPEKPQMSPAEEADAWMHAEMLVALFERLNALMRKKGVDVATIGDSYDDPDYIQGEGGRMMGSRPKGGTVGGLLGKKKDPIFESLIQEQRREWYRKIIDEVAEAEGFDTGKLKVSYDEEVADHNGKSYKVQGKYNPGTGLITIYPAAVGTDKAYVQAVVAHEIQHDKFQVAMQALRKEADRQDGPAYNKLRKHFTPDNMMKLQTDDGVTRYSTDYWEAYKSNHENGSWQTATNETLAEMSAEKVRRGKLPGTPRWQALHNDISALYPAYKKVRS